MTATMEFIQVPAHTTARLTVNDEQGEWVFTQVRTGCIRVQRGDFCAYLTLDGAVALRELLTNHIDTQVLKGMGIGDDESRCTICHREFTSNSYADESNYNPETGNHYSCEEEGDSVSYPQMQVASIERDYT